MRLNLGALGRLAARAVDVYHRSARPRPTARPRAGEVRSTGLSRPYPGDWTGPVRPVYRPLSDGQADPGEIVWTWVPFEEDHRRGKDRPVLVVDRAGDDLLCLMLTSRDRTDGLDPDPDYVDVGAGPWDPRGRPSEVKLDRVVRVLPADVRREGAVLPEDLFDRVAARLVRRRG
ncbi:type II toxin-antitoxin system PemK/MazF family toxin [Kocuria sp. SM24M-10]|uniref:type II toxin-antitoxin system PemK/MazF family toxin n=1 Tax=Kocuria sp. SM24M-10 TaxID=1660349 RepID=UPI00064A3D88|nr:type II toxin-antitoxin system PemK/MazF family toxin [Kocuria sp. SM24M-10]KLU10465.1 RNA 3'-terminal phosphate cyclase [Kocuria sp. SM24M-10]